MKKEEKKLEKKSPKFRMIEVTLKGETPLLMHKDNIEGADELARWTKAPENKGKSKAGDDRTPAWTWVNYCYHDGKNLVVDADNLMSMLRDAGAKMKHPVSRGSLKTQAQSLLVVQGLGWEFRNNGKLIPWPEIEELKSELDFDKHLEAVKKMGFSLSLKRASIKSGFDSKKHIRVRPMFEQWETKGKILVMDSELFTDEVIQELFNTAGIFVGLCDWRPGSKSSPGHFGCFTASFKEVK